MKQWIVTLAAAMSLLLCLATVGLWVRSRSVWDALSYVSEEGPLAYVLCAQDGSLVVGQVSIFNYMPEYHRGFMYHADQPWRDLDLFRKRFLGFGWVSMSFQGLGFNHPTLAGRDFWMLQLPLWALVAAFGAGPVLWVLRCARRRGRGGEGNCRKCGYDLRATPDRCPECGNVAAAEVGSGTASSAVVNGTSGAAPGH